MAISINDAGQVGAPLGFWGKEHLDPKTSVQYVTDLESLNDYLPNYSLVIVEEGEEEGTIWQLQPDGSWNQLSITGNAAMLDDEVISTDNTYSSSKIDNTYAKIVDVYDKTTADTTFGTLTQQESNTNQILQLESKVDSIGDAVQYKGNVGTYGELLLLEDVQNGSLYIVDSDETMTDYDPFPSTKYIWDGTNSTWIFNGVQEISMRNFSTHPINLGSTDENGIYHTEVTGTLSLDNISFDDFDAENVSYINGSFTNVKEALDSLLYKDLAITFSTNSSTTLEKGNVVSNPTFNWSYSKDIIQQVINDEVLNDLTLRTYTYNGNITSNKTITLKANDGTKDFSKSISFAFYNAIYSGCASLTNTIDSDFITGLQSKKLSSNCKADYTVNCGSGEYIYFAIPSSISGYTFWVNGFQGGFHLLADNVNIENIYNATCDYDVWISDNHSLGTTTVTIK